MWPHKISIAYDSVRDNDIDSETQSLGGGRVEKQEDSRLPATASTKRIQQIRNIVLTAAGLVGLWILLVTAWHTTFHPTPKALGYKKVTLECGNTTAEAEARGCSFDLLSHNWVAPQCLDPVTESEYRAYVNSSERMWGAYPYFLDHEGRQRIPDERAFSMLANGPTLADQHVYTTREEHLAHCNFLLRRSHRAAIGLARLNDENAQFWHAEHCLGELRHADRKPLDELNEGFYVGYSPCTIEIPA